MKHLAFPFDNEFIQLGSTKYRTLDAHERLGALVTPARRAKIEQVVRARRFAPVVVMENIYDRGNQAAVMRSAEAYGFARVHMIEDGAKLKDSQRTTAGADKWLEKTRWKSTEACLQELKRQGLQILVTVLSETSIPLAKVDWGKAPVALLLGNEKEGASAAAQAMADQKVILPMRGFVQSFNISVAAALCFAEMDPHYRADLDADQIRRLECEYFARTLDSAEDYLHALRERGEIWGE